MRIRKSAGEEYNCSWFLFFVFYVEFLLLLVNIKQTVEVIMGLPGFDKAAFDFMS